MCVARQRWVPVKFWEPRSQVGPKGRKRLSQLAAFQKVAHNQLEHFPEI